MAPLVLEHRSLNRAQNRVTKSGNKKTTLNSLMNQAEVSIKIKQPSKNPGRKTGRGWIKEERMRRRREDQAHATRQGSESLRGSGETSSEPAAWNVIAGKASRWRPAPLTFREN